MKTISDKTFDVAREALAQVVLNLAECVMFAIEREDEEARKFYTEPLHHAAMALIEFNEKVR